jgi:hypothetical protein
MVDKAARKRRRRGMGAFVMTALIVLGLVVAFFLVDAGLRSYAERQVKQEISANLPKTVTGDVSVSIGGLSVIVQYLTGNFDRVDLRSAALSVDGVPASVHIVATDVPLDKTRTVGAVRGLVDLDQKALATLLGDSLPNAELTLGTGKVNYTGTVDVFGFPIGYQATAVPTAEADSLLLTPSSARITSGAGSIDAGSLLSLLLGKEPIRVCVAQYLPAGVTLSGVDVTPDRARITLASTTLKLTRESLTTLGSCSN